MTDIACKWVRFAKINKRNRKTDIYEIYHKNDGEGDYLGNGKYEGTFLGYIKWHSPWRQYCF